MLAAGTGTKLPLDGTAKNPDRCQRSLPGGKREIYGLFRDKSERMRAFFESTRAPGGRGSGIDGFQEEKEAKSGIFGRGSDFVGRISEIRRTSPRKNRTRARVTWISRSESSARCRIYARKNRIWGAVFRGLCTFSTFAPKIAVFRLKISALEQLYFSLGVARIFLGFAGVFSAGDFFEA